MTSDECRRCGGTGLEPEPSVQCGALTTPAWYCQNAVDGDRCKRYATRGSLLCRVHQKMKEKGTLRWAIDQPESDP